MMEPVGVYGLMVWPPPEASDYVQLWERFGKPAIPLVLQLQICGERFQAAFVMAEPGYCLVPPSPPGPQQH